MATEAQIYATGTCAIGIRAKYTIRDKSTKDYVRNYKRNMQNKPNFQKSQMNVNIYNTRNYERKRNWTLGENKPNQIQFQ